MTHKRAYCYLCCDWMVVCGTCGNNSCNGGYGRLPNGETCKDCEEAYQIMANRVLMMQLDEFVNPPDSYPS